MAPLNQSRPSHQSSILGRNLARNPFSIPVSRGISELNPPTIAELREAAKELGFHVEENELTSFSKLIERDMLPAFDELELAEEPKLVAESASRDRGHFPSPGENKFGAWAWKCSVKGKPGGILSG